jgi:hypothetical protein
LILAVQISFEKYDLASGRVYHKSSSLTIENCSLKAKPTHFSPLAVAQQRQVKSKKSIKSLLNKDFTNFRLYKPAYRQAGF